MYFNTRVPVPEKTVASKKGNVKYVMFRIKHYDEVRKFNTYSTTTVGKLCPDDSTKMIPNDKYLVVFPELAAQHIYGTERNNTLNAGAFAVFKHILSSLHIDSIVRSLFPDDEGDVILDLAIYFAIKHTNVVQGYPTYAKCHPSLVKGKIYSDATLSNYLHTLSTEKRDKFLTEWCKWQEMEALKRGEHVYASCDSTNISCQSDNITNAKPGHNKEKNGKNIVNIVYLFSHATNLPYIYDIYDGSINDESKLKYILAIADKYGIKDLTLILDRGYFCEPCLKYMDERNKDYIIMLNGKESKVIGLLKKFKNSFESKLDKYIPEFEMYGMSYPDILYNSSARTVYLHLYYNPDMAKDERRRFNDKIGQMRTELEAAKFTPKKFTKKYLEYFDIKYNSNKEGVDVISDVVFKKDVAEADFARCGYFVIISSENMTPAEALIRYKKRDAIEKTFARDKTWMSRAERVHSSESFEGKRLVEFISLILRTEFGNRLWQLTTPGGGRPEYAHIQRAIEELENVTICRRGTISYALDNPYTRTQKDILKPFDLNTVSMNKLIDALIKDLQDDVSVKML